ncbi:MAG: response regulator transcription factor [Clostridiales bacterium]|nr:response regulator transcription factor [Clostridiales bacterium]
MMKLLLADDEKELANALSAILKFNKYEVDCVYDGAAAYEAAYNNSYDALIFDVMMPKMSGIDAVKALREKNIDTPVILLTAKSEFSDKITGLDAGADDYLTKPFNTGELLARLRALIRRSADSKNETVTCGNITLNKDSLEIKTDSASFRLAGRECRMLDLLIARMNSPVSEQQFLDKVFDDDEASREGVVFLYISYLRTKLNAIGANLAIEETEAGMYMLKQK